MVTMMAERNMSLLTIALALVIQNRSIPQVAAESTSGSIPERRPRIHGGWNTNEDRHLYAHINLKWQEEGHQCGGSLVSEDMVLTAAHCEGSFDVIEIGKYEKYDVTDISEEFDEFVQIKHPGYDDITTRFDVMLVKLNKSATLAKPVRINRDQSLPSNGEMLTVIGMGYNANWELPDVFQEASVRYQINDQCDDIVDEWGITLDGDLYPDMLCAGFDGRDSCYGDSGSPLVLKGVTDDEDVQIGVVSWGYECAGTLPGIYSRLSYLPVYEFIEKNVCLNSVSPPEYMQCGKWMATPTPTSSPTTESSTTSPTPAPTFSPTSITLIESEEPTTERLREALSDSIFLHDSDLTLKTTGIVEDVGNSTEGRLQTSPDMSNEMLPEMSSAHYPFSSKTTGVLLSALFGAFWVFALI
mmetsp:Transcript_22749/g.56361  ORF Transcript_22749/g.56361 Transcript_22749/m.56361 type:complete len:413 (-) Transcript_22749:177-1415(-)